MIQSNPNSLFKNMEIFPAIWSGSLELDLLSKFWNKLICS
jgi:hypothetical protein